MGTTFADLMVCDSGSPTCRRVRVYAPNTIDLSDTLSTVDTIESGPATGIVFEDDKGQAVGWMLPGETLPDASLLSRRHVIRAHVIELPTRTAA